MRSSKKTRSKKRGGSSKKRPLRKSKSRSKSRSWGVQQPPERVKHSRANDAMNMTDLQFMAKSIGVPFGGLNKKELIAKINRYAHNL